MRDQIPSGTKTKRKGKSKVAPRLGREKYVTYLCYVIPGFLLYLALFVSPIILGIYYSLFDWNGYSKNMNFIGLNNYLKALKNVKFKNALLFNLKYSVILIICVLILSMILALILNKNIKCRTFFRATFFFPAVVSMLAAGLIFNEIFYRALPAIGNFFHISALQSNILSNKNTAMYGVLFVHIWQGVCIPTVLLMSALQTVPSEVLESSAIDGANKWQQFWRIIVPFLLPTISVILVLLLRDGLMVFDYIKAMTEGGPGGATRSITMLIYQQGFEENKFSLAVAESLMLSVILMGISIIQIKITQRKEVY